VSYQGSNRNDEKAPDEVTGTLLVTVTVYGGTLADAATALSSYRGKGWGREMTDLLNGGEFEVIAADVAKDVTAGDADPDVMSEQELREEITRVVLAQRADCAEHPMPFPRPSCWACARNGAFHRAALLAAGRWPAADPVTYVLPAQPGRWPAADPEGADDETAAPARHKARVRSTGLRYDGVRLWRWACPHWDQGRNRNCRGGDYGSWAMAVRDAVRHAGSGGTAW
jgi:hypothetical protein